MSRTWDYRLIESEPSPGRTVYSVYEVCYEDGKLSYYAPDPAIVSTIKSSKTIQDTLGQELDRMRKALAKPILKHADFYPEEN